jgi:hypothetical protein
MVTVRLNSLSGTDPKQVNTKPAPARRSLAPWPTANDEAGPAAVRGPHPPARADRHGFVPHGPDAGLVVAHIESELTLSDWAVVEMASQVW